MTTEQDPRTMHPRELVRGVMRGHRRFVQRGYTAENAVAAVEANLGASADECERIALLAYAEGFRDGMIEDPNVTLPGERVRPEDPE